MSLFVLLCIYLCTVCVAMQFESAMIGTLDELVAAGHGDKQYQELFYEMSVFDSRWICFNFIVSIVEQRLLCLVSNTSQPCLLDEL